MNKTLFVLLLSWCCYFQLFAQLADNSIAPNWQRHDLNNNLHDMYSYLNQGKVVVLNFATTWSPRSYNYATSNELKAYYSSRGPTAVVPQVQVFMLESDQYTTTLCLDGTSTSCGSAGSVGNFKTNINYPIVEAPLSLTQKYLATRRFPAVYMVCPSKRAYYIGQRSTVQLDSLMQSLCGVIPGVVPQVISVNVIKTDNSCYGNANGSIQLQPSDGTAPYSYKWNNNITATTASVNNLVAGNYTVTVTDSKGSSVVKSIAITQPLAPLQSNPTITDFQNCGAKGAIQLNLTGGSSPYSFNWSSIGTSTQGEITNLTSAGIFNVTITDSKGCTLSKQNLTVRAFTNVPNVSISSPSTQLSCSVTSVSLSPTVSPATSTYTYSWYNVTNNNNSFIGAGTPFSITQEGAYKVVAKDTNSSCESFATFSVASSGTLSGMTINGPSNNELTCLGPNYALAVLTPQNVTCTNCQYQWTVPIGANNPGNNFSATASVAGTYSVIITKGTCTTTLNKIITVNKIPPVITPATNLAIKCNAPDVTINPQTSSVNTSFAWSGSGIVGSTTASTIKVNAVGAYTLTATNTGNGCSATGIFNVQNYTNIPDITLTETTGTTCSKKITANATTGNNPSEYNFNWSTGTSMPFITVTQSGTYTVTCTNAITGCSATKSITVNVGIGLNLANPSNSICQGTRTLVLTSQVTNYSNSTLTYQWTSNSVGGIVGTANSSNVTITKNGIYTLSITSNNGCSIANSVTITNFKNLPTVNAGLDVSICAGLTAQLGATVTGGTAPYTYQWLPATDLNFANIANPISSTTVSGSYGVIITDANGCTVTDNVAISLNPKPNVNAGSDVSICAGASTIFTAVGNAGTPGFTYAWSPSTGLSGITSANVTATPTITTTYVVTITDSKGCKASDNVMLTVQPNPAVTISSLPIIGITCPQLKANPSGGLAQYTYLWSTQANSQIITISSNGVYNVTVTDINGCKGSASRSVTCGIPSFGKNTSDLNINDENGESKLIINPNPTLGMINISIHLAKKEAAEFTIYDYTGRKIYDHNLNTTTSLHSFTVDLSSYPNGIYLIKVQSESYQSSQRIIKR